MNTQVHTIDCTPSDESFAFMANNMLGVLLAECVKKADRDRAKSLISGILETYRYLYLKGYRYDKDANRIVLDEETQED